MLDKKLKFITLALAVLVACLAYAVLVSRSDYLKVDFFDVGQGDSAFIETPSGWQVLIDGGPDSTVVSKLGQVMPAWDRSLDVVVATHPEADHIAGLIEVLKNYKVDYVVETGMAKDTEVSRAWAEAVKNEGAKVIYADGPKRVLFGQDAYMDLLWPLTNHKDEVNPKPNNFAVVSKLHYGQRIFLFTADIERWTEQQIISRGINVKSDVLKIGHHGSKTSSSEVFLGIVDQQTAVISVGKNNKYGHPNTSVLQRLSASDALVLRTDKEGDIILRSDGKNIFR
ncbi:MAG: hypothetical protein A3B75_03040 [Candidatus Terrybacteria bacterium RIFCSPHIGHO2_02_FULL_43_14]|uniref:Metallo-beta-lactamase domain-containing protein n=1 Tax=Candidatus Terrybacteria bacterium RIFCSPHIGHO2_01_FULL_43_35 TaxID=1802361 RepID=A0A1G2PF50_9BACT|nr:MAG: hypothetical protein A2828_03410 [Candidatus Terrybacteria bacterium RIFCSPHIGHO2_01_FULL_43_35]OHA49442.1 MAG: hypothetical protein A3B75_03040 [Candidatus Terrybacteria bacterium RIFCSPHIGHO2_02_FULL_43_14]